MTAKELCGVLASVPRDAVIQVPKTGGDLYSPVTVVAFCEDEADGRKPELYLEDLGASEVEGYKTPADFVQHGVRCTVKWVDEKAYAEARNRVS